MAKNKKGAIERLLSLKKRRDELAAEIAAVSDEIKDTLKPVLSALMELGVNVQSDGMACSGCGASVHVERVLCQGCSTSEPEPIDEKTSLQIIEDLVDSGKVPERWVCDFLGAPRDAWCRASEDDLSRCAGRISADTK